jgi:hypothetical protein
MIYNVKLTDGVTRQGWQVAVGGQDNDYIRNTEREQVFPNITPEEAVMRMEAQIKKNKKRRERESRNNFYTELYAK